ncbi:hypothetical protein DFH09DRAFT_1085222 [Mycena vulgaris]|nr:hypothetical protein DFH09DRAFT_1085222 [Mycena vulgaris]
MRRAPTYDNRQSTHGGLKRMVFKWGYCQILSNSFDSPLNDSGSPTAQGSTSPNPSHSVISIEIESRLGMLIIPELPVPCGTCPKQNPSSALSSSALPLEIIPLVVVQPTLWRAISSFSSTARRKDPGLRSIAHAYDSESEALGSVRTCRACFQLSNLECDGVLFGVGIDISAQDAFRGEKSLTAIEDPQLCLYGTSSLSILSIEEHFLRVGAELWAGSSGNNARRIMSLGPPQLRRSDFECRGSLQLWRDVSGAITTRTIPKQVLKDPNSNCPKASGIELQGSGSNDPEASLKDPKPNCPKASVRAPKIRICHFSTTRQHESCIKRALHLSRQNCLTHFGNILGASICKTRFQIANSLFSLFIRVCVREDPTNPQFPNASGGAQGLSTTDAGFSLEPWNGCILDIARTHFKSCVLSLIPDISLISVSAVGAQRSVGIHDISDASFQIYAIRVVQLHASGLPYFASRGLAAGFAFIKRAFQLFSCLIHVYASPDVGATLSGGFGR